MTYWCVGYIALTNLDFDEFTNINKKLLTVSLDVIVVFKKLCWLVKGSIYYSKQGLGNFYCLLVLSTHLSTGRAHFRHRDKETSAKQVSKVIEIQE